MDQAYVMSQMSEIRYLVRPDFFLLHVVDESFVHHLISTRCRVPSGEIPVTLVIGASLMQPIDGLEDHVHQIGRAHV